MSLTSPTIAHARTLTPAQAQKVVRAMTPEQQAAVASLVLKACAEAREDERRIVLNALLDARVEP